jgi:NAD(P)-dependent dehydrogenase (short-subunit alcohol dehydrogenase family)
MARYNITVNAIAPGPFVTSISGGRLRDPAVRAPFEKFSPMRRSRMDTRMRKPNRR